MKLFSFSVYRIEQRKFLLCILYSPKTAVPIRLDRHGKFWQIAPFAMHQIVHAFEAAHLIGAVWLIGKA